MKTAPVQATANHAVRDVRKLVRGSETSDGAGVRLRRYIASPELGMLDPFLLLDAFRSDNPDDYLAGFPPHPHRGFETVTYLLHGNMRHRDSAGHEGVIRSGGIQWMTAGSGIEHSEMPEQENGLLSGFQLWVNLPAADKMTLPRYQEYEPEEVPVESRGTATRIRVIAGTTGEGTSGIVTEIAADPLYLDVSLDAETDFNETIAAGHNAFLFVIDGEIVVEGGHHPATVQKNRLAVLGDGDRVRIRSVSASRFLLIAGRPFHEPVARSGPFVMNTQEEIQRAFADYRSGLFGRVEQRRS